MGFGNKRIWRWILIAVIIIVLLGLVLHYFQGRYGDHFRTNRPAMVPKSEAHQLDQPFSSVDDTALPASQKKSWLARVQKTWLNFWDKDSSQSGDSKVTAVVKDASGADSSASQPASQSQPVSQSQSAEHQQSGLASQPAVARQNTGQAQVSPRVKLGPLPKLAQHSRQGTHGQHPAQNYSLGQAVKTLIVSKQALDIHADAVGTIKAVNDIAIAPQIAGTIAKINYVPGSFVSTGALLIKLDDRIYKANLEKSKSELVLSQSDYNRYKKLANKGLVAAQQLQQIKSKYKTDLAEVKVNQTYLDRTELRAPFAGVVGEKLVSIGDYVAVGQKLTTLVDRKNLLVNFLLPAQYLNQLSLGQKIAIIVPDADSQDFTGHITYVAPEVDQTTHSVTLQARIDNVNSALAPGLFVKVQVNMQAGKMALLIPNSAIVIQSGKKVVYRVVDGKAHAVPVVLGKVDRQNVVVLSGLTAGDRIVVVGQQQLHDGMQVREVSNN